MTTTLGFLLRNVVGTGLLRRGNATMVMKARTAAASVDQGKNCCLILGSGVVKCGPLEVSKVHIKATNGASGCDVEHIWYLPVHVIIHI